MKKIFTIIFAFIMTLSIVGCGTNSDYVGDKFTGIKRNDVVEEVSSENTPEHIMTVSEANAVKTAKNYLSCMAFSRDGLIKQLEYEKYSIEDAVFAVDSCNVDWNNQAVLCAKQYLSCMSFSYDGLVDQLMYEGFTYEQALYGVNVAYN